MTDDDKSVTTHLKRGIPIQDHTERPRAMFTSADRAFLLGEKEYNHRQSAYNRRETIKERVQHTLLDFSILIHHLREEELKKIISWPRKRKLEHQLAVDDVIAFLYLSQYEQHYDFEARLSQGLQTAWRLREGPDTYVTADLDIEVAKNEKLPIEEIIEKVKKHGVSRLNASELEEFGIFCEQAEAIDFDALRARQEWTDEYDEWWTENREETIRRRMPSGKWTPTMDPEVYEEEGIGDMSDKELIELFGEGFPYNSSAIYDGENVHMVPPPSKRDDEESNENN